MPIMYLQLCVFSFENCNSLERCAALVTRCLKTNIVKIKWKRKGGKKEKKEKVGGKREKREKINKGKNYDKICY